MESGEEPVDLILNQMQDSIPVKEMIDCLETLSKLIQKYLNS